MEESLHATEPLIILRIVHDQRLLVQLHPSEEGIVQVKLFLLTGAIHGADESPGGSFGRSSTSVITPVPLMARRDTRYCS